VTQLCVTNLQLGLIKSFFGDKHLRKNGACEILKLRCLGNEDNVDEISLQIINVFNFINVLWGGGGKEGFGVIQNRIRTQNIKAKADRTTCAVYWGHRKFLGSR